MSEVAIESLPVSCAVCGEILTCSNIEVEQHLLAHVDALEERIEMIELFVECRACYEEEKCHACKTGCMECRPIHKCGKEAM